MSFLLFACCAQNRPHSILFCYNNANMYENSDVFYKIQNTSTQSWDSNRLLFIVNGARL